MRRLPTTSPRLYVRVHDLDGKFVTAYWPARRVDVKPGKTTIHYHATNSVTWDTSKYRVTSLAQMWEGPLPKDRFSA